MPLEFRCSQCGQLLRVPETSVGKNARCPKCQGLMLVQASAQPAAVASPSPADPPSAATSAPPANSPANPFGEPGALAAAKTLAPSAATADSVNPYASPAIAQAYQPGLGFSGASQRPGLPWEVKRQDFGVWWETARLVMMTPSLAFSEMRLEGGLGQPMMFALWGLGIGFVAQLVWQLPLTALPLMLDTGMGQEEVLGQIVGNLVGGAIGVVLGATLGLVINAAITHVTLMLLGGPRQSYEATLRVAGYSQGSVAWINIVPLAGPVIAAIWGIVLGVLGLARAHEISIGKAALAVLLPIAFCIVAFVVLVGGLVWMAIAVSP